MLLQALDRFLQPARARRRAYSAATVIMGKNAALEAMLAQRAGKPKPDALNAMLAKRLAGHVGGGAGFPDARRGVSVSMEYPQADVVVAAAASASTAGATARGRACAAFDAAAHARPAPRGAKAVRVTGIHADQYWFTGLLLTRFANFIYGTVSKSLLKAAAQARGLVESGAGGAEEARSEAGRAVRLDPSPRDRSGAAGKGRGRQSI